MSFLSYDREYTEHFTELLEDYKKSDKWAVFFVIVSAVFIFVSTAVLEQDSLLSSIGGGMVALLSVILYKRFTGHELFRVLFSVAVVIFAVIFIQVHAGSMEAHLYIFVSMTIFLLYKDTKPLDIATTLIIIYYLFTYKLQGNNSYFLDVPILLFETKYSIMTLGIYLFFIVVEWGILRIIIKQLRQRFFDFIDADDEVFEKYKELKIYDAVYENTDNGIIVTTPEGMILSANKAFERLMGYSEKYLIGKNPRLFKSEKQNVATYRLMWIALEHKHKWEGEIWNKREDGKIVPFWLHIDALVDDGVVYHYIGVYMDRSKLIQASKQMDFMAQHDTLTELPNKETFTQQVKHAIYLSYGEKQLFALLSIDLDRFKNINDTMGHEVGDALIVAVSKRIKEVLRQSDIVARPGGDEFLVLLEKIRNENEAAQVASQILEGIRKPFTISGNTIHVSASIGISLYPVDGENDVMLIKAAESAMYQAKNSGKNSFEFFTSELSKRVLRNMKLENALHHALKNGEISLVFQPQCLFKTGKLMSAEALIRWHSKEFGFVGPDEFIPIAEESGLIIELGEWVFRNTCKAFRSYKAIYPDLRYIAVNVSSKQFCNYDIAAEFPRIIEEEGITTADIGIELTERSIMEQIGENVLDTLRAHGFKISIDDFGTGYSSMSYLKSLPIDVVKVDKSFVDGLPHNESDVAIVKAILALIQSLGYDTVAEGIEYKEQAEMLNDLGCDIAQGYYFSKPLNHEDFLDYLTKAAQNKLLSL